MNDQKSALEFASKNLVGKKDWRTGFKENLIATKNFTIAQELSNSGVVEREALINQSLDAVYKATGDEKYNRASFQYALPGDYETQRRKVLEENALEIESLKEANPDIRTLTEITELEKERAQKTREVMEEVGSRADGWGMLGGFAGAMQGLFHDPWLVGSMLLGTKGLPQAESVLAKMLHTAKVEGAIGLGVEAALAPKVYQRKQYLGVDSETAMTEAAQNILFGGVAGAGFGAMFAGGQHLLAKAYRRAVADGTVAPTRDADAAADLLDQVAPLVDGKPEQVTNMRAHVEAVQNAIAQIERGENVDVSQFLEGNTVAVKPAKETELTKAIRQELETVYGRDIADLEAVGKLRIVNDVDELMRLAGRADELQLMTGWHGSSHKYDKPDLSNVGTGEGAQAYGWGYYLAEKPETAKWYQRKLSDDSGLVMGSDKIRWKGGDVPKEHSEVVGYLNDPLIMSEVKTKQGLADLFEQQPEYANSARWLREHADEITMETPGYFYEIDLPDETVNKMLDWNAPLSDTPAIRKLWNKIYDEPFSPESIDGARFYEDLTEFAGSQEGASMMLDREGIPGIKYLDGMSRIDGEALKLVNAQGSREAALDLAQKRLDGVPFGDTQGRQYWQKMVDDLSRPNTRNFVSFNPDRDLRIVSRNGEPVEGVKFSKKQQLGANEITGNLDLVNKNVADAVKSQIKRMPGDEGKRVLETLKKHEGTAWAAAAVKGLAYREMLEQILDGKDVSKLEINAIWGKQDMSRTTIVRTFKAAQKQGNKPIKKLLRSYDFIGNNRKAEQDISTSFANCDPSKACAEHCYAAGNTARPNDIAKSEFTELMIERFPDEVAEVIAESYEASAAGKAGLALRLNDKGDLSPAQVILVKKLNERGIAMQVFSKRPELLRELDDMNLKMLSVDSTNIDIAAANPDLRLAVTITDDMTEDMISPLHDRVSVYLPVNLKGKSIGKEELRARFPKLAPRMFKENLCPVDGGSMRTETGTSFVDIKDGTAKKGTWTCTACDLYGCAGCFKGDRKTSVRKANSVLVTDVRQELKIKAAKRDIDNQLKFLLDQGEIDEQTYKTISATLSERHAGLWSDVEQARAHPNSEEAGATAGEKTEGRAGTGRDDKGLLKFSKASGDQIDWRLRHEEYTAIADFLDKNWTKGGNVSHLMDERGHVTGRTASINPDWVQSIISDGWKRDDAIKVLRRAVNGDKLTERQQGLVTHVLDAMEEPGPDGPIRGSMLPDDQPVGMRENEAPEWGEIPPESIDDARMPPSTIQGAYANGTAYLVAGNLQSGRARGVFLHEIGEHAGLADMLGPELYTDLGNQFDRLLADGDEVVKRAADSVPGDTRPQDIKSEQIAYLVESVVNGEKVSGKVRQFVDQIIAAIKAWFYQTPGYRLLQRRGIEMKLTPDDIVQLAHLSAKRMADKARKEKRVMDAVGPIIEAKARARAQESATATAKPDTATAEPAAVEMPENLDDIDIDMIDDKLIEDMAEARVADLAVEPGEGAVEVQTRTLREAVDEIDTETDIIDQMIACLLEA